MGFIDKLLDRTTPGLTKMMDLAWRRNEVLTANIANIQTPQYRAVDLNFGKEVEKAFNQNNSSLMKTNTKHLDIGESGGARIVNDFSGATRSDGNNVDLDMQMGRLMFNQGRFTQSATILRKKLGMIRSVIRDSRG